MALSVSIGKSGGIDIALGELRLAVSSTFSEAVGVVKECPYPIGGGSCPLLRAVGTAIDPPQPVSAWTTPVAVEKAADGSWTVSAAAVGYRLLRTVTVESHRVRVQDQLTTTGNRTRPAGYEPTERVGIEITHRAAFASGAEQMQGAVLPGALASWACHSIAQEEATPVGTRVPVTSSGNPTIHAHSALGGVGILPLDDVFETHSYGNISAFHTAKLPVQSDPPEWRRKSNVCSGPTSRGVAPCVCTVTDPPSISLVDANLVLPPGGEVYVQEWAIYPLPASCPDYYCFVNSVRSDLKVDEITMPGTGYLAMYPKETSVEVMEPAGFSWSGGDWAGWDTAELDAFYRQEATHFVVADNALSNRTGVCGGTLDCEGGCFLNELPETGLQRWQTLINKTRGVGGPQRVFVYQNSGIDTSHDASAKHTDSAVTDAHGKTVAYRTCAAGQDYPLFFGNTTNSCEWPDDCTVPVLYSLIRPVCLTLGARHSSCVVQMARCWRKSIRKSLILDLMACIMTRSELHAALSESCHFRNFLTWLSLLQFLSAGCGYTFSLWDRFSGTIHPTSKNVEQVMGSVVLLTQEHEIGLIDVLRNVNRSLIANGQPATRTLRDALRVGPNGSTVAGGPGGATLHFQEDSPQASVLHTHLWTPMTLNRYAGQRLDLDPKYNASCAGTDGGSHEFMSGLCVGRNIGDSLDFGVTTFLYDGLFHHDDGETNILHALFPLTVRRLDEGLIVGRERVVTKKNGTAKWAVAAGEWDYTVRDSRYDNRNPLRPPLASYSSQRRQGVTTVVVQTFGRDGLLNATRTVALPSPGAAVEVSLVPGQVVVLAFAQSPHVER